MNAAISVWLTESSDEIYAAYALYLYKICTVFIISIY